MKNKLPAFLLLCGTILAGATLAPVAPLPPPPSGPGPYVYECPVRNHALTDTAAQMYKSTTFCMVTCTYADGKKTSVLKAAPQGLCEATEDGAIYQ